MTVQRIESMEDDMRDIATYELSDGQRVSIDARVVREVGAATILREHGYGHLLPTDRLPVTQSGRAVGTVSPDFDPAFIKSKSFLYDPRPGDFVRGGKGWKAAATLGPGDFEMIPGFVWDTLPAKEGHDG